MTDITTRDLRESLTLLLPRKQSDSEGGWRETWKNGPRLWASIWPLLGRDGYIPHMKGDPMMDQKGYLKTLPPPRYRIIIRAGVDLPLKTVFSWHLFRKSKRLLVVNKPVLIQYNRFLRMIAVETNDD